MCGATDVHEHIAKFLLFTFKYLAHFKEHIINVNCKLMRYPHVCCLIFKEGKKGLDSVKRGSKLS